MIRRTAFKLHRYLGLIAGLIIVIVGLTGSLLVFRHEINHFLLQAQFGQIVPQQQQVSILSVIDTVKAAYPEPKFTLSFFELPTQENAPIRVELGSENQPLTEVIVNPYTGKILGDRIPQYAIMDIVYNLHNALLTGETGTIIVGITAFFLFLLSITGIILWPGWRKLIAGFKIKTNASIKRLNFDIHKVVGIIAAIFLAITGFTGFCWNFYTYTQPIIYAATFTPTPTEPKSKPREEKSTVDFAQMLKLADEALPGAKTTYISFPSSPESVFMIGKQFPEEKEVWRSRVYLDRYTGKVLKLRNSRSLSLGDEVVDSFNPLHFGTFGGLPTRVLYFFVGLSPLVLFITGFIMWWHQYKGKRGNLAQGLR